MKRANKQEAEIKGVHDTTDKIKAENRKLKAAIEKNTLELETKNRELEIESALEKVRAIALSMNAPADMPDVCRVIAKELKKLGVEEIRNVQTAIFYEAAGTYMNYEYYAKHDKTFITQTSYTNHKIHRAFANKMLKGKEGFIKTHIPKAKLPGWIAYQKTTNVFIDSYLKKASSLTYYWYSLGPVALGISTYKPLNKNDIELFKRFRNVFELAYRRFLDIELAIAQAKEARIETALERVRAVAMAMRKPDDLLDICKILYEEFHSLGFKELRNSMINIYNDDKRSLLNYDYSEGADKTITHFIYNTHSTIDNLVKNTRGANDAFIEYAYTGKELDEWRAFREKSGEADDPRLDNTDTVYYYFYSIGTGSIGISTYSSINAEKLELLKRFRNVFNLSYQRYTDIALAEAQAKESRLETALERVRAVAMAMKKSEELTGICEVMYNELTALGFTNIRNAQIAINMQAYQSWLIFEYSDYSEINMKKADVSEGNVSPLLQEIAIEMAKSKDALFQKHISGKEFEEWRSWRIDTDGLNDPRVATAHSMGFYLYGVESGLLGISTFGEISEQQVQTLKRFKNVFELSYRRYADVAQAEAQAREAKIELALERVRARTMAMQKSEELAETAYILLQQFNELGEAPEQLTIGIINEPQRLMELWLTLHGSMMQRMLTISIDEPHVISKVYKAWQQQKKSLVIDLQGKKLKEYNEYRNSLSDLKVNNGRTEMRRVINFAFFSKGQISVSAPEPLREEGLKLLERFAAVFDGTYTRFLDLQKAEAQAREAQIETALEKVRSRSLAMQKSEELKEVIQVVYDQFIHLNINVEHTGFIIDYKASDDMHIWLADQHAVPAQLTIPYFDSPHWNSFNETKQKGTAFFANHLSFEEKNKFYQELFKLFPALTEETKEYYFNCTGLAISTVLLDNAGLYIENFDGIPYSDEENKILMRFGKVFQQTYTRFLDLQKAEAQSREAKIQLALERVRARTMAMQHSNELPESALLLFQQVQTLGMPAWSAGYCIWDDDKKAITLWMSSEGVLQKPFRLPTTEDPSCIHMREAYERGEIFYVEAVGGKELGEHYKYMRTLPVVGEVLDGIINEGHPLPAFQIFHLAYFSQGFLLFITYEAVPEAHEIFKRFAKVFEQTYTRFLDLQKAEAQVREAKVEAALERTRTQSMLMQHSNELDDTLRVFHEQILLLGIHSAFSFLWLPDEEKDRHVFWAAWAEQQAGINAVKNHSTIFKSKAINYPLDRNEPATAQCLIDWKSNEPVYSYAVLPGEVENYFAAWSELIDGVEKLKPEHFAGGLYYIEAFMKYGCFGVITATDLTEDEKKILARFAIEFERAYTRFLDLQKAEAQVRESQIQLALERIRARTMAMHKSEELSEISSLLFQQVKQLGVTAIQNSIGIVNEDTAFVELSTTIHGSHLLHTLNVPIDDPFVMAKAVTAWRAKRKSLTLEFEGQELKNYNEVRNSFLETKVSFPEDKWIVNISFFSKGWLSFSTDKNISGEIIVVLKRFAAVFEQTYTRFLDLQKAEAQAREAQIELSLERVRAKTMAMHSSHDVADSVLTLFDEVTKLGIETMRCGIGIMHDAGQMELWTAKINTDGKADLVVGYLDMTMHPLLQGGYNGWKNKEKSYSYELKGDDLNDYYSIINNHPDYPVKYDIATLPERIIHNEFYFPEGTLYVFALAELSAESKKIFFRFAAVFGQTYRRYLDLQKAEAQAREAQVEAALEKVRSRSLAMHHSNELQEVVNTVFERLKLLAIDMNVASIFIFKDGSKDWEQWVAADETVYSTHFHIPYVDLIIFRHLEDAKRNGKDFYSHRYSFEEKNEWFSYAFIHTEYSRIPNHRKKFLIDSEFFQVSFALAKNTGIQLAKYAGKEFSADENEILKRFSRVFEQAYIRFLDLQKAEAQAREANIEASLERIRSRTMAMHNSQDVGNTIVTMFDELVRLDVQTDRCGILIGDESDYMEVWTAKANANEEATLIIGKLDMMMHPMLAGASKAWKNKESIYTYEMIGEDLKDYYRAINNANYYPVQFDTPSLPVKQTHTEFFFPDGAIFAFTPETLSADAIKIFKRFASVFALTYRRYLDLQKAEAQAREAQIEASLERVRSRAMAMQTSEDLSDTVNIFFKELKTLGIIPIRCGVGQIDAATRLTNLTTTSASQQGNAFQVTGKLKQAGHPVLEGIYDNWLLQKEYYPVLKGDDLKAYYDVTKSQIAFPEYAEDITQYGNIFYYKEGFVFAWTEKKLQEEELKIFRRFTSVLSLTYRRYTDLKEAEAQAKESKIETALERVRAIAMSMMKSDELLTICEAVFKQLQTLGFSNMRASQIYIRNDIAGKFINYDYSDITGADVVEVNYDSHANTRRIYDVISNAGDALIHNEITKKELDEWKSYLFDTLGQPIEESLDRAEELHYYLYSFGIGAFGISTFKSIDKEELEILKRFRNVFNLSYQRYTDISLAEAQTKEAKIEAALEKVRGRAMAMHNSNDLSSTASTVFTELRKLGINPIRCGVGLLNKESRKAQLYSASASSEGDTLAIMGWVELAGNPVLEDIYDAWLKHEDYFPEQSGEQLKAYYESLLAGLPAVVVPQWESGQKEYGHFISFSVGCLYAWSAILYNDAELKILKRFTNIIDLTFRRYIELQKTEASAREAVKQAALDRVRADIASMRTVKDLDRITPLIWNELTVLGIPFIRCGVFIMDEQQQLIHTFLSTPDGKAVAAFHLPYDTAGNLTGMVDHWRQKKIYITHWDENDFANLADTLVEQGAIANREQYINSIPHEGIYLHFLPFLQGMLYAGNTSKLSDDETDLIQSVAYAFSTAYARYEDFNKLEAAKQQVENTLVDLKQAQTQLVQSEKMASLGELTAGIAHEIQNPLNFVNNFSEVSKELLDEMKAALDNGNIAEAEELAKDVIKNLEKINHHGKRADAIVKGMLQHSRSSSAIKELTDINALTDEYIRLCYHGLRAKDKSFNAIIKTDFDKDLFSVEARINIVPQDIGRVLLNLLTNAFYATNARRKAEGEGFEPTVSVSTKNLGDKVEITVSDNGSGIPQNIVDKIFQPFFTTKPTGQGTGLGLSLSYDIIKAHGGEIFIGSGGKVETKENEARKDDLVGRGTEFVIQLPTN